MERRETVRRVFEKSLFAPCTPGLECKLVNHRLQCVDECKALGVSMNQVMMAKLYWKSFAPTYKCVKESGLSNMELVSELCYAPTIAVMDESKGEEFGMPTHSDRFGNLTRMEPSVARNGVLYTSTKADEKVDQYAKSKAAIQYYPAIDQVYKCNGVSLLLLRKWRSWRQTNSRFLLLIVAN